MHNFIASHVLAIILLFFPLFFSQEASLENYEKNKKVIVKKNYDVVKVTMYNVDPKQTDSTPTETASGFIVDSLNPKKHRIIAVSHDLKRKMKWGQKVKVTGIGKHSGVYYVRDLMNKRWKKRIDILVNSDEEILTFNNAKLYILK